MFVWMVIYFLYPSHYTSCVIAHSPALQAIGASWSWRCVGARSSVTCASEKHNQEIQLRCRESYARKRWCAETNFFISQHLKQISLYSWGVELINVKTPTGSIRKNFYSSWSLLVLEMAGLWKISSLVWHLLQLSETKTLCLTLLDYQHLFGHELGEFGSQEVHQPSCIEQLAEGAEWVARITRDHEQVLREKSQRCWDEDCDPFGPFDDRTGVEACQWWRHGWCTQCFF